MMISSKVIPVYKACSALEMSRSSYYARDNNKSPAIADIEVKNIIENIALEFSMYGYRRITKELHSSIGYVPPEEFEQKILKLA